MSTNVFPTTRGSIFQHPDQALVIRHVMETYAWPLKVYFLGTNMRTLGEPDEIVNGFFASRMQREDYLDQWLQEKQASGMRLRRWLMNGLCMYLREEYKRSRRHAHDRIGGQIGVGAGSGDAPAAGGAEAVTFSGDPNIEIDRAAAIAFVQRAMTGARAACERKNMLPHWEIFLRHHVDGLDFRALAGEFGVDEARAHVMSRSAERNFKSALAGVLVSDGVSEDEIDTEINRLLEVIGS